MQAPLAQCLPWQEPLLQRALQLKSAQRLPHAILLDSRSSTDTSAFIHYLSTLLLCDAPDGLAPCGRCEACRMMQAGTYADFRLVTMEEDEKTKKISKNIKIDQVRDLIYEVSLTRRFERLKIAALYPAEAMNTASANALLKTLEEPAAGVLLLVCTHNRGRIPVTIRSRCQTWSIELPPREDALAWLRAQDFDAAQATLYLEHAGGDPVLALELREQDYAALVESFKGRLARFLRGQASVGELCQELLGREIALIRRLVQMTLSAYCYQLSGVNAAGESTGAADPARAQQLFDLRRRAQNQLRIEENNLDLQIQLEDVLISLKQILTRRLI